MSALSSGPERDAVDPARPLDGKVALVTGAAGGIGAVTSAVLARAGARVALTDLPGTPVRDVAARLTSDGLEAAFFEADLTDEASVEALVGFAVERFGGLDVVDNNAAATLMSAEDFDVTSMSVDLWDRTMSANLRAPMLVCKHAIPVIIERGGGSIVNISSGLALTGDFTRVAYSCSKAGVIALTRHIATAHAERGVRCNAIAPGLTETPSMREQLPEPIRQVFIEQTPIPRLGRPEDIAHTVLFLASDHAAYVNGQVLCVDGGLIAHTPTAMPVRDLVAQFVS